MKFLVQAMLVLSWLGTWVSCNQLQHSSPRKTDDKQSQKVIPAMTKWYPRLGISRTTLLDSLTENGFKESRGFGYRNWSGLDRIHNRSVDIASYYLWKNKVVMIYIANIPFCHTLDLQQFEAVLGPPTFEQRLPSSTSRHAMLHIYAEEGIAISVDGKHIEGVELFEPMSFKKYCRKIYKKPPVMNL